jgi:hypothetical protein
LDPLIRQYLREHANAVVDCVLAHKRVNPSELSILCEWAKDMPEGQKETFTHRSHKVEIVRNGEEISVLLVCPDERRETLR